MNDANLTVPAAKLADIRAALALAAELENFHTKVNAVMCALANMDAFSMLPADKYHANLHNAGCALLDIVEEDATRIAGLKYAYGNRIASLSDSVAEMFPDVQPAGEGA